MNRESTAPRPSGPALSAASPAHQVAVVFLTKLGWMAIVGSGTSLRRLTFGHVSAEAARRALGAERPHDVSPDTWSQGLVRRLTAYAGGARDDFRDVEVDLGSPVPRFRGRVLACCRQIPYGSTLTYGQLAARAGSPNAARAVGCSMAANPVPLVIPCHRVVGASGGLGGYSAAGGIRVKRKLLLLEARGVECLHVAGGQPTRKHEEIPE
ncbi:MAG: methylated-DNA--[protein]-cysteine S-methyltransferase [Planctomycetes bacterium]|nr:methylated-DNA--[protein]-cysteine S-methyltransferase [Planctomycetota bacterium]